MPLIKVCLVHNVAFKATKLQNKSPIMMLSVERQIIIKGDFYYERKCKNSQQHYGNGIYP